MPQATGVSNLFEVRPSAELRLAAACCVLDSAESTRPLPEIQGIDWARFAAVVKRHRIEPLVNCHRTRLGPALPAEVASAIKNASVSVVSDNLRFAAESALLLRHFRERGLQPLFVKGLSLGKLAYDSIALKRGWDIDLLVEKREICTAASVLRGMGYVCILPGGRASDQHLVRWACVSKESIWHHESRRIFVELHTRLVDNPLLLRRLDLTQRQEVDIVGGIVLPTLADDSLFSYLCVHGASSCWFRLKWIADLAALLAAKSPEEVGRLYRMSQEMGAGRAAAQALLLCEELFGTSAPADLMRSLRADRRNRLLMQLALYLLDGGRPDLELEKKRFGTWPIHLAQLFLLKGWHFKVSEVRRQTHSSWHSLTSSHRTIA